MVREALQEVPLPLAFAAVACIITVGFWTASLAVRVSVMVSPAYTVLWLAPFEDKVALVKVGAVLSKVTVAPDTELKVVVALPSESPITAEKGTLPATSAAVMVTTPFQLLVPVLETAAARLAILMVGVISAAWLEVKESVMVSPTLA